MTPKPQEHLKQKGPKTTYRHSIDLSEIGNDGEKVVISGMSGLYPQSRSVKELSEILYNKINPIKATSRWKSNHPEAANDIGEAPDVNKFDAQFFMINYRMADVMDPMGRKLLEQAYQAIYDAGVSPAHLSEKKIGVYVGASYSEGEKSRICLSSVAKRGLGVAGCSRAKIANRISYWLNARGPSVTTDDSCCSAITALEQAYFDITSGRCEGAIVGGCNMCLQPQGSVHYRRVMPLSKNGKVKAFDQNADGTSRSDAINVLFLQKAKDALRIYAEIVHVKSEYTSIPTENIDAYQTIGFCQNPEARISFLRKFYEEANISPQMVEYVEAFGSGIADADKIELDVISKVFCKERIEALAVGSVMSNIGFTDAAAGISGITKVLLGYHNSLMAGNLHCENPRQDIQALQENRMHILADHYPCRQTLAAVNAISYLGMNSHVLLRGHYKPKDLTRYKTDIPHLVTISGRNEFGVRKILDDLRSRPIDSEELALLHNIHEKRISGHLHRGFGILGTDKEQNTVCLDEAIEYFDDLRRPLWFVYSGMGSQWTGMGVQLMKIPVFASAIKRCHAVLESKGIDIINIITSCDKNIFDNILNSFVGIAAMQVALTDVLRDLGLVPDKIIGHSVGEIGCAYADGCLTVEEMMLAAYYRGAASLRTTLIKGSLVAVGMGYKQMVSMCPPGIYVACHNGPNSCTLSGPAEDMSKYVSYLTSQGIFAREVPCSNIAYHSKYIAPAGPWMLDSLKEIIKTPKLRSNRWLSTSVPQEKWKETQARYSSAEYYTNNLLSPVLFEEVLTLVPANAVLIEIAPHGLLQAILKQSLPETCLNVPLTRRKHPESVLLLLKAAGTLYNVGYNLKIQNLYPKVEYPVSTGTPLLSHLVEWIHSENWSNPEYNIKCRTSTASCTFPVSLYDDNSYLKGHVIKGMATYPFAGALVAVWDTLAMTAGLPKKQPVKFSDVSLYSEPIMSDQKPLELRVNLQRASGYFEVLNGSIVIITGHVYACEAKTSNQIIDCSQTSDERWLQSENIYQLLNQKDYSYRDNFRSIKRANFSLTTAELAWNKNWVTFLDGIFQFNTIRRQHSGVSQLLYINSLFINTKVLQQNDNALIRAYYYSAERETRCCGLTLRGPIFNDLPPARHKYVLKYLKLQADVSSAKHIENSQENYNYVKLEPMLGSEDNVSLESNDGCNFNSPKWVKTSELPDTGIHVTVHYAGINSYDIDVANGSSPNTNQLKKRSAFGMDFSGVIERSGQRVMGLLGSGAVCRRVCADPDLLWPVPAHWSLQEAATVPLPYIHAFYCLTLKHELHQGNSILVVGGAGALGQAVISIALARGCEVFTTVSNDRKKQLLLKEFSELKGEHIFNSRNSTFKDDVLIATKGIGCDVVINCIRGSSRTAALRCCKKFGITIDVVQISSCERYALEMSHLDQDRQYTTVDISSKLDSGHRMDIRKLQLLVSKGIEQGYVRPLTSVTYEPTAVTKALHLLSERRHQGRVLLDLLKPIPVALPRLQCSAEQYQWIICDNEIFSLMLAQKLIECGAKKLHFNCSSASTLFDFKKRNWQKDGILITVSHEMSINCEDIECLKGLEGIYVVATKAFAEKTAKLVNNLDMLLRKLCVSNKFNVISIENDAGQRTCLARALTNLPATFIHLPMLNEIDDKTYDIAKLRGALDAIERAILSGKTVLTAYPEDPINSSQSQPLTTVVGIDHFKEADDNVRLQDLGLQFDKLKKLSAILRNSYNIYMTEDETAFLTLKQIQTLEQSLTAYDLKRHKGLAPFFSYIDNDEVLASTEMIFLPTRTFGEYMRDDEFDVRDPFLCLIPGIDGHHDIFREMCKQLNLNAIVLQSRLNGLNETIEETASRYAKILLEKMKLKDSFYLLGYESGVLVALEVASILEDHGFVGKIFCVGLLPEEFQMYLQEQLSDFTSDELLQDAIIQHTANLLGYTLTEANTLLLKSLSWEEKISLCTHLLSGRVPHTHQYIHEIIKTAYEQIRQAKSYKGKTRALKSQIILLKTDTESNIISPKTLQLHSQNNISVYELNVPLSLAAKHQKCASTINKYLDRNILTLFENRNICDSYLDEIDLFFTHMSENN